MTTAVDGKCGGARRRLLRVPQPAALCPLPRRDGFTILNNANNHSYDFGNAGQAQTIAAIHHARMAQTGLPGEVTVVQAGRAKSRSSGSRRTTTPPTCSTLTAARR